MADNKLPQEFKTRWIEALRSGNFEQGAGALKEDGKYCCLGVAAAIQDLNIPEGGDCIYLSGSKKVNDIPLKGLRKIPRILWGNKNDSIPFKLATMNDDGCSFEEIADYIEENL